MPRKVSLADLQAREAQAQARLARERQTLARLKKQTTQAERTARQARWWALGEAVEATWGAITPAEFMAHFRTVHGGALPVPATVSASPTREEGCDVHDPLAVLAHVVQAILTGHLPAERLLAVPSPQAMRTGTVHTAAQGASPATALTNARCTLYSLALLVQDGPDRPPASQRADCPAAHPASSSDWGASRRYGHQAERGGRHDHRDPESADRVGTKQSTARYLVSPTGNEPHLGRPPAWCRPPDSTIPAAGSPACQGERVMAIIHFSLTPRVRSTAQVAQRAVHYLTREGPYAPAHTTQSAQREVGYLVRETTATRARGDLVWHEVGNMPAWAQGSASRFFTAAAAYERVNGRWGLALQAALPRELSREQQRALTHDFLQAHLPDTPYLVVLHEPRTATGETQPHIHVLFSERRLDGIARDAQQFFKRANPAHPERGGAAKDRFWNERRCPGRLRQAWVDLTNFHLERAGHDVRMDARSLYARGIDREAERKAGWQGREGRDQREQVQQARTTTTVREQQCAREHWEQRKQVLGITNVQALSPEAMQEKSRTWARDGQPGRAIPPPSLEQLRTHQETMRAQVAQGEQVLERLEAEVQRAAHREHTHTIPSWDEVQQTAAVLEQAVSIGLLDDEAPQRGITLQRGWDTRWAEQQRVQGRGLTR